MTDWLSPSINFPIEHAALGAAFTALTFELVPAPWDWAGLLLFIAIVGGKESIWDPGHEKDQPFFWAGATDWFFYLVGIGFAVLLLAGRGVIHGI